MDHLPPEVARSLVDAIYRRSDPENLLSAFEKLGTPLPSVFREFYEKYEGPFSSTHTGFVLLDLCEQPTNVVSVTEMCRRHHGWPARFVVLTDLLGNAVLTFDSQLGHVLNVDFEGGDQELLRGTLPPSWMSFADFLRYYFG